MSQALFGRDAELAVLRRLVKGAREGSGGAAVVVAEPGGGKTSLLAAAADEALASGMTVLWATAAEATSSVPWLPLSVALSNALERVDADALRNRLKPRHRLAALVAPALFPDYVAPEVDEGAKVAVFEAVLQVLAEFAANHGATLVLDDLQWADVTTQQCVSYLAARCGTLRLALLLALRDAAEDQMVAGLERLPGVAAIRPKPLERSELTRLARSLTGSAPRLDVISRVARESAGNPFAATELLLAYGRGSDAELPANVRRAVLARTTGLGAADLAVLEAASVLDRDFEAAVVARIARRPASAVLAALGRLTDAGLLERASRGRHRFRHALIANAVRAEADPGRLAKAHASAAGALGDSGAPPGELAHHLFAAGLDSEAVPLALKAAEVAERWGGNVEASLLFERAAASTPDAGQRGQFLERAAFNSLVALETERSGELAVSAIELLRRAGRPVARAHATHAAVLDRQGNFGEGAQARRQALAEVDAMPPSSFTAHVLMLLSAQLMALGQPEEAISLAERSVAAADAFGDERSSVIASAVIANCLGLLGHLDEAIRLIDEAGEWGFEHGLYMPSLAAVNNAALLRTVALRGREARERLDSLAPDRRALLATMLPRTEAFVLTFVAGPSHVLRAVDEALVTASPLDGVRLAVPQAMALIARDEPEVAVRVLEQGLKGAGADHRRLRARVLASVAAGLAVEALPAARQLLEDSISFPFWAMNAEAATEALVAGGMGDTARAGLRQRRDEAGNDNPWWQLARARVELTVDPMEARGLAAAAAARFESAGYLWDAGRANLVLADALVATGAPTEARAALVHVSATAREHGIKYHARLARERLAHIGEAPDQTDVQTIRKLLETLGSQPADLRQRVEASVAALLASGGRNGEAGAILRDYYIRRVGSQEVVAEIQHLTRPTFYRRLHLGWRLLAERLGAE